MSHRKDNHPELLRPCRYFLNGNCAFRDEICWYSHKPLDRNNLNLPQTLTEYTCNHCEKVFERKAEFMRHRKSEHPETTSECRENKNSWCRFKDDKCWFKHFDSKSKTEKVHSPELIQKVFNMMEKFTKRIGFVENKIENIGNRKRKSGSESE
eukprot:GFUD01118643.1.p1 GENE.GFUD01118643.1~~GFUD01118643.1.p1  ORF type:complete len:153 (+),score=29.39 GFUD01118643.1:558-1016(+)